MTSGNTELKISGFFSTSVPLLKLFFSLLGQVKSYFSFYIALMKVVVVVVVVFVMGMPGLDLD